MKRFALRKARFNNCLQYFQAMMESLIAVAQESPALYLNNGVLLSDMKNMAETLFLALRSVTGKLHHSLIKFGLKFC
jgi:hypothetical protein